jgi:hypothetical protein
MSLTQRLATASAPQLFELLREHLTDKDAFHQRPSVTVRISDEGDIYLLKSAAYEACMAACLKLPALGRLAVARAWAAHADPMHRLAAANLFDTPLSRDDPAWHDSVEVVTQLTADSDTGVAYTALSASWMFRHDPAAAAQSARVMAHCEAHPVPGILETFIRGYDVRAGGIAPLVRFSQHPAGIVRRAATSELGWVGNGGHETSIARTALSDRLDDPDALVRHSARDGLTGRLKALFRVIFRRKRIERDFVLSILESQTSQIYRDLADRIRTDGDSDRRILADVGLVPEKQDATIASASILDLFELLVIGTRTHDDGVQSKVHEELRRRPAADVKAAAQVWADTKDFQDLTNFNIVVVEQCLSREAAMAIRDRVEGKLPLPTDLDALFALLEDPTTSDERAEEALGTILNMTPSPRSEAVLARLQVCERHPSSGLRGTYAHRFWEPQSAAEEAVVIRLSRDPSDSVRLDALTGLANCRYDTPDWRDAVASYLDLEGDDYWRERWSAIETLARRGDARAVDAISKELRQSSEFGIAFVSDDPHPALLAAIEYMPRRRYVADLDRWSRAAADYLSTYGDDVGRMAPVLSAIAACRKSETA